MTPLLSIRAITKRFGDLVAVNAVNLDVADGEFVTFLGPSGSGKSTLLYVIAGLETASEGEILLREDPLLAIPPHKRNIGMVFQRYTLFPHMSIEENIAFPLAVRGWSRERIEERLKEMLALVRLEAFRGRRPSQLSGGQQQRVALARALSYEPRILLMDEPLAALDKKLKEELQVEIRRIHRETGVTILYVTHDQEEALRLADRIAVFNHGRVEQVAPPAELYEKPASRFVGGFVGNSNFLSITLKSVHGGSATAVFPDGTVVDALRLREPLSAGDGATLLLRPEKISVAPRANGVARKLIVTLTDITYLGETLDIDAKTAWGEHVSARIPVARLKSEHMTVGSTAAIDWPDGEGIVFSRTG